MNGIPDCDRLEMVLVALEGTALTWFQWREEQVQYPRWQEFKEAVLKRFQPGVSRNPMGPLLSLKQTRPVMEYRKAFKLVSSSRRDVDREIIMGIFVSGLKLELQAKLKVGDYMTLYALMGRAMVLEERNLAWKGEGISPASRGEGGGGYKGPNL